MLKYRHRLAKIFLEIEVFKMTSTLKNILEQTVLGCQNVKRLPSNKSWDSSFSINNNFIVEISRVSTNRSVINVYNFNDFQNQALSKKNNDRV